MFTNTFDKNIHDTRVSTYHGIEYNQDFLEYIVVYCYHVLIQGHEILLWNNESRINVIFSNPSSHQLSSLSSSSKSL